MSGIERAKDEHDRIIEKLKGLPLVHLGSLFSDKIRIHDIVLDIVESTKRLSSVNNGPLREGASGINGVRESITEISQDIFVAHPGFTDAGMEVGLMANYAKKVADEGTIMQGHLANALGLILDAGRELAQYEKSHDKAYRLMDDLTIKRDEAIPRVEALKNDL